MKKYFILAAAALAFAACTNDEIVPVEQVQETVDDGSVQFDAYVPRGTTRAGVDGILTTNSTGSNQISLQANAFGVFGYYTNGESYTGNTKPNFFYNQKVEYSSGWTYSPLKYWPNEFGSDAISDEVDRVSLFAYAPWVDVDGLTGLVKDDATNDYANTNIVSMTRNTASGDPFVKYVASMDALNSVDLCYGVAKENYTSSASGYNINNVAAGKPYVDVVKPATGEGSRIKFNFKHALAQLNVTLKADVADITTPGTEIQTTKTRIWVRSVMFTGVTQKGQLNLHEGEWYDVNAINKLTTGSLTVFDGRKNNREANDPAADEKPATFNPAFVQNAPYTIDAGDITAPTATGVTSVKKNLFRSDDTGGDDAKTADPVFVIPTGEEMTVTIVYDVETVDPNLSDFLSDGKTHGSTIENTIHKTITSFGQIEAGKKYTLNLILGMHTVDFEATVTEWTASSANVDLPHNAPTFTKGTTTGNVLVPANEKTGTLYIRDLTVGSTLTGDRGGWVSSCDPGTTTPAGGIAPVAWEFGDFNDSFTNREGTVTVTESGTGTSVTKVTITQNAHALGLGAVAPAAAQNDIVLTKDAGLTGSAWSAFTADATHVKVWKNGEAQNYLASPAADKDFCFDTANNKLTFYTALAAGETYKIWMQQGDAPAETITVTVLP